MIDKLDSMKHKLPSFSNMIDLLDKIKGSLSESDKHTAEDIRRVLIAAAELITTARFDEEDVAIEIINDVMR